MTKTLKRSEINLAGYNPRRITAENKKNLKKSIKKYGMVGGIVFNERTNTLVQGHQRISVLDEINKYPEKDYDIEVSIVDLDEKSEKELNIVLNNKNAQGEYDGELLKELLEQDIDIADVLMAEADIEMLCGLDDDIINSSIAGDFRAAMKRNEASLQNKEGAGVGAIDQRLKHNVINLVFDNNREADIFNNLLMQPIGTVTLKGSMIAAIVKEWKEVQE